MWFKMTSHIFKKEETSRMRKKRFLAVIMAASMMLGSSATALAATGDETTPPAKGNLTGYAHLEGVVDPDVFVVNLPVTSNNDVKTAFDFIMDPQGLIEETEGARYVSGQGVTLHGATAATSTNKFEHGTLYFANTSSNGTVSQLSPTSNKLTITNKGTMDVDVKLTAKVVSLDGIELVSTNTISDGAAPSVYLALSGNDGTQKAITTDGISMEAQISGNDGAYSLSWNTTDRKYEKIASENAAFEDYSFMLTGASGGKIKDWLEVQDDLSNDARVEVTWMVTPEGYASSPFASDTLKMIQGQPIETDVTLPAGATGIAKIEFTRSSGEVAVVADANYVFANGKLKFRSTYTDTLLQAKVERVHKVTFNDAANTTAEIKLVP